MTDSEFVFWVFITPVLMFVWAIIMLGIAKIIAEIKNVIKRW